MKMKKDSPFKECLLVPTSFLIKKEKKKKEKFDPSKILSDKEIPVGVRLKMFDNYRRFHSDKKQVDDGNNDKSQADILLKMVDKLQTTTAASTSTRPPVVKTEAVAKEEEEEGDEKKYGIRNIIRNIPSKNQSLAIAILFMMIDSDGEITWNNKFEVIIEGITIVKSDIRKIIGYLVGALQTVTSDGDIPIGTQETYTKLKALNIPDDWIKKSPPRQSSRQSKSTKIHQSGKGKKHKLNWIIF